MATAQLQLISTRNSWQLDKRTLEVGRAGIAQARAALASAHTVENPLDATYAECKSASYQPLASEAVGPKANKRKSVGSDHDGRTQLIQQQLIVLAA